MKNSSRTLVLMSPLVMLLGCTEPTVSYNAAVKPFLDKYCIRCHSEGGEGTEKSGFRMDSYDNLMAGTRHGPVIKPGESFTSALVMLVEGRADPSLRMPHDDGEAPEQAEINVVKLWIDQGAENN